MKRKVMIFLICLCTLLVSCKKTPPEVTSTEKRGITTRDGEVKLHATSDERFTGSAAAPVAPAASALLSDAAPADWTKLAGTPFRLLNYSFGADGSGEVYVSRSQGSVIDNINRWRKQFGAPDFSAQEIAALPTVKLMGTAAVVVEAQGRYESGMGKPGVDGYALAGVVALVGTDIFTIKMVGPQAEVEKQKENLLRYAETVRIAE